VEEVISAILRGEPTRRPGLSVRVAHVVSALSDPWHVPSLVPELAPRASC